MITKRGQEKMRGQLANGMYHQICEMAWAAGFNNVWPRACSWLLINLLCAAIMKVGQSIIRSETLAVAAAAHHGC